MTLGQVCTHNTLTAPNRVTHRAAFLDGAGNFGDGEFRVFYTGFIYSWFKIFCQFRQP
jgi:hypothetical protein